jgi:transcriptional regulator with XRE-family HTH domain
MVQRNFWGNLIRELRVKKKLSQRRLARSADVNRSTLRAIEAGRTTGDILTIERLLEALDYELEALERPSHEQMAAA